MENTDGIQNLKMLLPLIYILPSYLLYFIMIYKIFGPKSSGRFSAPFFKLFGISAIVYVFCSIIYFFAIRIPQIPLFLPFVKLWGERSAFLTFLQTSLWYVTSVAPLFHMATSFNRFTVFILKSRYENFWRRWLLLFVLLCILLPGLVIWHIPFQGIYMQIRDETDPNNSLRFLAASNRNAVPWMNNPRNAAIVITITSILSLFFNLYCAIKLIIEKYFRKNSNLKKTSRQDILLTVYTMLVFVCDILHCIHQYTILTIHDEDIIVFMFEIQSYIFDMTDLAPAWFIIITNKNLRKQIFGAVLMKKQINITIASMHSTRITVTPASAPNVGTSAPLMLRNATVAPPPSRSSRIRPRPGATFGQYSHSSVIH